MIRPLNLNNFFSLNGYSIVGSKVLSKSNIIVGLCETKNNDFFFKKYLKYKKIDLNTNYYRCNKIRLRGTLFLFKMFYGYKLKYEIYNENSVFRFFNYRIVSPGTPCFLKCCLIGSLIYDLKILKKKQKFATSAGSYITLLDSSINSNTAVLEMPSGLIKEVNVFSLCTTGRNANIYKKFIVFGKAGNRLHLKKKKISVRGVAMNPIDHPNGGRTKIKKPFRNVWGHVAKKKK